MQDSIDNLRNAEEYSTKKVNKLKERIKDDYGDSVCAITVGSFARKEATPQSDLDYFVITDDESIAVKVLGSFPDYLKTLRIKEPSDGGAFGGHTKPDDLLSNLGGKKDDNDCLTKRLLFLMESECLSGMDVYNSLKAQLIEQYVKDSITQHQLARFLLNDLIRYYRTICVDFEYKTYEQTKTWGDRNIKLMFSRKLMFFSGILVVAKTVQSTPTVKRAILSEYLSYTPIERIKKICGARADAALELYSQFIGGIGDEKTRDELNKTVKDGNQSDVFRNYKNMGHHFTWALSKLLSETFDASHPIHLALKF